MWRPFPGGIDAHVADPFFLLDQLGPVEYAPNEAVGAPWHPHRGFETVTYVIDGVVQHHDSNGGGGIIGEGDTQWMTAGSGILHDEVPTEAFLRSGGRTHGVQLWVNLPAALKRTPPRYQAITGDNLTLLTTPDGGALVRAHRRRPRRPRRPRRHPHADHLRARVREPGRAARGAVESERYSAMVVRPERPRLRRQRAPPARRARSSWCSGPAT